MLKIVIECSGGRESLAVLNMLSQGAQVAWVATDSANAPSRATGKPTLRGSRRDQFYPSSVAVELTPVEERNLGPKLLPGIARVKVVPTAAAPRRASRGGSPESGSSGR
jgi:hypothetical protein